MECGLLLRFMSKPSPNVVCEPAWHKDAFQRCSRTWNIRSFGLLVSSSMVNNFSSDNDPLSSCWAASRISRPLILSSYFCITLSERKWTVHLLKDLRWKSFFTRFYIAPNETLSSEAIFRTDSRGFRRILSNTIFLNLGVVTDSGMPLLGTSFMSPVLL